MVERNPLSDDAAAPDEPAYLARRIDASAMKAFAHPLRMAMYDYLNDHESATATMLAKHTGESTGQTSYHLRQLERHGFVEEDIARGSGRERWWKAVGFRMDGDDLAQDSSTRPAVTAMLQNQVSQRAEALRDWFLRTESETRSWQNSSLTARTTAKMTAQESTDLNRVLMETIHEHTEAAKARHSAGQGASEGGEGAPEGDETRQVRIYLDVFPLPTDD
ncbi:winged helix-turn-helix domain-containing protein [Ornithinimicrobium faecis]|uniref:winged helix-turn-helix domain-containing protein n=1 Tax=Ornithinimicrobium faecis TaxID=2934158 RepID=UPI0021174181|nr:helix-turn-helix domain-containing protein [Ornithinimicrobium sp. HY1745]